MRWLQEPLVNSVVVDPDGTRDLPHPYEPLGEQVSDGFCRRCGRDSRHDLHVESPGRPWPYELEAQGPHLELRVPSGKWYPFRKFVTYFYVPCDVEWRLAFPEGSDDPHTFPVLTLPPDTHTVRFERGTKLRLVLVREASEDVELPPLFPPGQEPQTLVGAVVSYGLLGAATGLALAGEAWDAYTRWRAARRTQLSRWASPALPDDGRPAPSRAASTRFRTLHRQGRPPTASPDPWIE